MQLIMWGVFAATMAMAGLVVHSQRRSREADLSKQPTVVRGVSVKLPNKWKIKQPTGEGRDARILAEATESVAGRASRAITVYQDTLLSPISPGEYLLQMFDVQVGGEGDESDEPPPASGAVHFGPYPGILAAVEVPIPGHAETTAWKKLYAAAMLPSGKSLAIRLEGTGQIEPADVELIEQVAASMSVSDEPAIGAARESVRLGDGIEIGAPEPFRFLEQPDPLRKWRRLWYAPRERDLHLDERWASIDCVP